MTKHVHFRPFIRRDMPDVLTIERESFEFPWSESDFVGVLRENSCVGVVAECDHRVVGFMIYKLRRACIDVLNFAVATGYRRCGVGTRMAATLTGVLCSKKRARITAEVSESNYVGHKFWASCGFRGVSVLRGTYCNSDDDAYLFVFRRRIAGALVLDDRDG